MNRERILRQHLSLRVFALLCAAGTALAFAGAAQAQRYVVVYEHGHVASPVAARNVSQAGGQVVATYSQIGVVIAESSSPTFEAAVERLQRVHGAAATAAYASATSSEGDESWGGELPNEPATDGDTFSGRQWGLDLIHAKEVHAVTGGSPAVLVGHIDTGVDGAHPELAANLDAAQSTSCVGGAPNQEPAAWADDSGHGTHTAGIIAAADNGVGVVGVAPNVRLVAIKASIRQGTRDVFLPEAVVCSFMWAAAHGVDVANNSYSVDSTLVGGTTDFCREDENQKTIIAAIRRSVEWATFRGVTVIASAGNSNLDVAANECLRLPSGLPGVVTVAGVGPSGQKSSFSNFGLGYVDVAAPAGEVPPFAMPPASFILSSFPAVPSLFTPTTLCDPVTTTCPVPGTVPGVGYYRFMAGTSQAAAHVSGVAALIVSRYGHDRWSFTGQMRPKRVRNILMATADPQACPADARCQADGAMNGFNGAGIVNALRAVTEPGS
jgi:lantibiotic leader peptide-processing serine protease